VTGDTGKAALDAHADQVLAGLAGARRQGGELTGRVLPLTRELARQLRVQFPGRGAEAARVLVTVASELAALGRQLTEAGMAPQAITPVLVNVLCYAAEELNREGTPR
jgi:hypothetical protein